jgi:DNA-binding XRE family transcriptional regulator
MGHWAGNLSDCNKSTEVAERTLHDEAKEYHHAFSIWLNLTRKGKDLSLLDVAEKTGLSKAFIWDIEKGRRGASIEVAVKLAKVFNQELWEVLKDIKEET